MKHTLQILTIVAACFACTPEQAPEQAPSFNYAKNLKFNHLYVVIDEVTYTSLFDSIPFFRELAYVREANVDAGEESWTGKYISGNQDYLEIFKPGGAENTKAGDLGIAFMPNLLGTTDSLYNYWKKTRTDSIRKGTRNRVIGPDQSIPWFNAVTIHDRDSLRFTSWVMEYTDTFMKMAGFTEEDLTREISHAEYSQRGFATRQNISYDSARYMKLYERVTSLSLSLSSNELDYFRPYLTASGFEEMGQSFTRADFQINYEKAEGPHQRLRQIELELLADQEPQVYSHGNLTLQVAGKKATIRFGPNDD